jgi:hypothetical protein
MTKTEQYPTIWMGLGIFERLYSDKKIEEYFRVLDRLPNKKVFILADEITGCNNFVLAGKKFDRVKDEEILNRYKMKAHNKFEVKYEFIQNLISREAKTFWEVKYWDFLSSSQVYTSLLNNLRDGIQRFENNYLKKEVLKVTIFGFGARLRKNFTASFVDFVFDKNFYRYLETLSEYTIEEVAATFYLAQKGWIKAGHAEEKPFDQLSLIFFERFNKEFLSLEKLPEFYYINK